MATETLRPDEFIAVHGQYVKDGQVIVKGRLGSDFISWFFEKDADCFNIIVDEGEVLHITPKDGKSFPDSLSIQPQFWRRVSDLTPVFRRLAGD